MKNLPLCKTLVAAAYACAAQTTLMIDAYGMRDAAVAALILTNIFNRKIIT